MLPLSTYESETKPDWCPGCGDFGVLNGLKTALGQLNIPSHKVLVVSGIGCSSNLPGFINAYGFHSLHGRAVAVATGARLANHDLHVVVVGGDGDGYGIGIGHFIHAMRRNLNLTYIVMNNEIYGLTTGQLSPTSELNMVTKSSPAGSYEQPINPIALAVVSGATYVARGFSGDPKHMAQIIENGIKHKGFSLVDVFSPCVTFNKQNTYEFFRKRVYRLEDEKHPTDHFQKAIEKSQEWGERIPIGLFYKNERLTYEDQDSTLKAGPLAHQKLGLSEKEQKELVASFI